MIFKRDPFQAIDLRTILFTATMAVALAGAAAAPALAQSDGPGGGRGGDGAGAGPGGGDGKAGMSPSSHVLLPHERATFERPGAALPAPGIATAAPPRSTAPRRRRAAPPVLAYDGVMCEPVLRRLATGQEVTVRMCAYPVGSR